MISPFRPRQFKRPNLNMGHRKNSGLPSIQVWCRESRIYFRRLAVAPIANLNPAFIKRRVVVMRK